MPSANRRLDVLEVDCQTTDAVGDLVYVQATDKTVEKVDVTVGAMMPASAAIIAKLSATRAIVQLSGPVELVYTGLTPGGHYIVGASGTPSLVAPAGPGRRYVQHVGVAFASDVLVLNFKDPTIMNG